MRKQIDWTQYDPLIGTMPDRKLAELIGCGLTTLFARKKILQKTPRIQVPEGVSPKDFFRQEKKKLLRQLGEKIKRERDKTDKAIARLESQILQKH